MVFDDQQVYSFGRKPEFYRWTTPMEYMLYSSARQPEVVNPTLAGYDTLAVWREAVTSCGKRFHVYLNTRGLKLSKGHPDWVQQDASGIASAWPRPFTRQTQGPCTRRTIRSARRSARSSTRSTLATRPRLPTRSAPT
jgi:hypothetical protein